MDRRQTGEDWRELERQDERSGEMENRVNSQTMASLSVKRWKDRYTQNLILIWSSSTECTEMLVFLRKTLKWPQQSCCPWSLVGGLPESQVQFSECLPHVCRETADRLPATSPCSDPALWPDTESMKWLSYNTLDYRTNNSFNTRYVREVIHIYIGRSVVQLPAVWSNGKPVSANPIKTIQAWTETLHSE